MNALFAVAQILADGKDDRQPCPHCPKVEVLMIGKKLGSCPHLARYFRTARQDRGSCSVLLAGAYCPFELHNNMIALPTAI